MNKHDELIEMLRKPKIGPQMRCVIALEAADLLQLYGDALVQIGNHDTDEKDGWRAYRHIQDIAQTTVEGE